MSEKKKSSVSGEAKFLKDGLQSYPKALDVIHRFEELVLGACREAFEDSLKRFDGRITKMIGRAKTTTGANTGAKGKWLYAGRYGDLSAVDVGLYWENDGTPSVWASVCVADKSLADWLKGKLSKKERPEAENDEDYKYRFTYYENVSGVGIKGLIKSMKEAMQKWPEGI